METNKSGEEFDQFLQNAFKPLISQFNEEPKPLDPDPWWMSNPDEVRGRYESAPETFRLQYPEKYKELLAEEKQAWADDPTFVIAMIQGLLRVLPSQIEEAQKVAATARIRELTKIQISIQNILRPPLNTHDLVWDHIRSHNQELNEYLHQVIFLKQDLTGTNLQDVELRKPVQNKNEHINEEEFGFDTYILEQYRSKLMPFLIEHYTSRKPKDIVPALYALERLNVLSGNILTYDQTALHSSLKCTFGDIGGRTSLCDAIHKYHKDPAKPNRNPNYETKIEKHRIKISDFLKLEESK